MISNLSYKKKNLFLLAATLIFALLSYSLAVKKTFILNAECKVLESQLMQASSAPKKIINLEKKMSMIDNLIGNTNQTNDPAQKTLLGIVSAYCQKNNIILKEFPKALSSRENELLIETNVFTIQGDFIKLLNLVYQLEQKNKIGKLASLKFQRKKDNETKNTTLLATVYLRNIKKTNNEK